MCTLNRANFPFLPPGPGGHLQSSLALICPQDTCSWPRTQCQIPQGPHSAPVRMSFPSLTTALLHWALLNQAWPVWADGLAWPHAVCVPMEVPNTWSWGCPRSPGCPAAWLGWWDIPFPDSPAQIPLAPSPWGTSGPQCALA